ncbi:MAG: metallophosphoesterase family protein [Dehalococcoidia bacterium]
MLIGLISDTHIPEAGPELWPQVYERFEGVDLILHAGDIHVLEVIDRLERIAPIYVARGNGDDGGGGRAVLPEDKRLREAWTLELGGFKVGLTHDIALPEWPPQRTIHTVMDHYFGGPQHIVVHGDTHLASVETLRGVLLLNPGSPMYPRNLDTRRGTLGFLEIQAGRAHAWLEQITEDGTRLIREQPRYV